MYHVRMKCRSCETSMVMRPSFLLRVQPLCPLDVPGNQIQNGTQASAPFSEKVMLLERKRQNVKGGTPNEQRFVRRGR